MQMDVLVSVPITERGVGHGHLYYGHRAVLGHHLCERTRRIRFRE
jgi:hypothetical protein